MERVSIDPSLIDEPRIDFDTFMKAAAKLRVRAEEEAIVRALSESMELGDRGVFIARTADGQLLWAVPHRAVPYGFMYEGRLSRRMPDHEMSDLVRTRS